jgi:hypothetical protein
MKSSKTTSRLELFVRANAKKNLIKADELFEGSMEVLLARMLKEGADQKAVDLFRKQATIGADMFRIAMWKLYGFSSPSTLSDTKH